MIFNKLIKDPLTLYHNWIQKKLYKHGITSNYIELTYGRIHYYNVNPNKSGTNLVLVHGLGSSNNTWHKIIIQLSNYFNIFAIDLFGHGASQMHEPKEYLTFEEHRKTLSEFIDKVVHNNFVLMGHSFGGWLSLSYVVENPWNVSQLVLFNSSGINFFGANVVRQNFLVKDKKELSRLIKRMWGTVPLSSLFLKKDVLKKMRSPIIVNLLSSIKDDDYIEPSTLQAIFLPVLVIWGTKDKLIPSTIPSLLSENLPKCDVSYLEKAGHFPHLQSHKNVIELIKKYVIH